MSLILDRCPSVHVSRGGVVGLIVFAVLASGMAAPGSADAQDSTSLPRISQDVVVTAAVAPVSIEALSRTVSVLTRDDLDRFGLTSVIEALRLLPGVDPRARGPRDIQTDFSIRGATFGQSLVLVDGWRLNDSQTGHHNGEIPMAVSGIDRIEVMNGASSAIYGADGLGGTINVVSRTDAYQSLSLAAGQFGYISAAGSTSGGTLKDWSLTGWGSRSGGFVFDRDFAQGGAALRGSPAAGLILDLRHQRRAFGAAGFYGNSPSKEWTDQTLAGVSWQTSHNSWITTARGLVRHHADHFLWDIIRPEISRNRHRTNAGEGSVTLARDLGAGRRFTVGASGGGDWVASTNLGDRHFAKIGALAELLLPVGTRATVQAAARFDGYSTFGRNLSPSASVAVWPVSSLRLRASAGRAFRVPTFTELYYHDPGNLGNPDLVAERGWTLDGGVDWIHRDWTLSASPFRRWDNDVIDWVKPTAPDLWRSANVRDVTSTGVELSVSRAWRQAIVRASYATLTVDAPALPVISKYLLEYAKHQAAGSVSLPIGGGLRAAINIDHRRRLDGQEYSLVGARISRTISRFKVFVDATNLLDEQYHEVAGVAMPGRWMTVGVDIR